MADLPAACPNCDAPLAGVYCARCGQRNVHVRLHARELAADLASSLSGWDARLPRTVRELTTRPGEVAREYVSGHRRRFAQPLQYFLTCMALQFLALATRGVRPSEISGVDVRADGTAEAQDVMVELMSLMDRHLPSLVILAVPVFAMVARRIHRASGMNFAESCVLFLYVAGHAALLSIPFRLVAPDARAVGALLYLAGVAYYVWAARAFYRSSVARATASVLLGQLAWMFLGSVTVVIAVLGAMLIALAG